MEPADRVAGEEVPLVTQVEHAAFGVPRNREHHETVGDRHFVGPGDHVGGIRRRLPICFVDPHACPEVVGELLRVGDVVLVREQHVGDPAVGGDGVDHVGAPVRRVHEEATTDLGYEPGVGAERTAVVVPAQPHARRHLPRKHVGRLGATIDGADGTGRAREGGAPHRQLLDRGVGLTAHHGLSVRERDDQIGCVVPGHVAVDAAGVDVPVAVGVFRVTLTEPGHPANVPRRSPTPAPGVTG